MTNNYNQDIIVVLFEADDTPLSASDIHKRLSVPPTDVSRHLRQLYNGEKVERAEGSGNRGDPYRYELTASGISKAKDLVDDDVWGDDVDEGVADTEPPAARDDEPDPSTESAPDRLTAESVDALRHTVEGLEERIGGLEDIVGSANVEREDARHRLRQIESSLSGADNVVTLSDGDLADAVYLIANADCAGSSYSRKTKLIAGLIGSENGDSVFERLGRVFDDAEVMNVDVDIPDDFADAVGSIPTDEDDADDESGADE